MTSPRRFFRPVILAIALSSALITLNACAQQTGDQTALRIKQIADGTILPLMARRGIPGMAVGIIANGKPYAFNYGVASKATKEPVAQHTLFEIGSISKTFTATLTAYAQRRGYLSLSDNVGTYIEPLRGSAFGKVTLLELGTHTAGTLPMQVPDDVNDNAQLSQYLKKFRSTAAPGTTRVYSNLSIGLLGLIAANAMKGDFPSLMQERVFEPLGLRDTYVDVPPDRVADYAQGYTRDGKPIRMAPGELWQEAYGIRTTASDLLRFLQANMNLIDVAPDLQLALTDTHTGYFRAGAFTQDLIWEQYAYPVTLKALLAGTDEIGDAVPATALRPPERPETDVLLNKTGSTNGFSAYVAFVPARKLGIVLLANRSYPLPDRVTAAYNILVSLVKPSP